MNSDASLSLTHERLAPMSESKIIDGANDI